MFRNFVRGDILPLMSELVALAVLQDGAVPYIGEWGNSWRFYVFCR